MWGLLYEVQIDDLVVMPSKLRNEEYAIGRFPGHHELVSELVDSCRDPHARAVRWLKTGIPSEQLANLRLPPRGTITRLSSHDIERQLEAILD
jgi:predicted Mrr-cat superfamily restriction endonuclease